MMDGIDDEDAEMTKRGLNSPAIKNLDVEYTRMIKEIKVPAEGGGLEAAAAAYGAERAKVMEKE